jgi:hypothetical protein
VFDVEAVELPLLRYTLKGTARPKKISRIYDPKTGKHFPSKADQKWHGENLARLKTEASLKGGAVKICSGVWCRNYVGDEQIRDASNLTEGVLDLLVDAEVFIDDSDRVIFQSGGEDFLDRENPRTEVYIFSYHFETLTEKAYRKNKEELKARAKAAKKKGAKNDTKKSTPRNINKRRVRAKKQILKPRRA